jgi:hypothetical protein
MGFKDFTPLSEVLKPNMGDVHLQACFYSENSGPLKVIYNTRGIYVRDGSKGYMYETYDQSRALMPPGEALFDPNLEYESYSVEPKPKFASLKPYAAGIGHALNATGAMSVFMNVADQLFRHEWFEAGATTVAAYGLYRASKLFGPGVNIGLLPLGAGMEYWSRKEEYGNAAESFGNHFTLGDGLVGHLPGAFAASAYSTGRALGTAAVSSVVDSYHIGRAFAEGAQYSQREHIFFK